MRFVRQVLFPLLAVASSGGCADSASAPAGQPTTTTVATDPAATAEPSIVTVPAMTVAEADALLAGYDATDQLAFGILAESRRDPAVVDAAGRALAAGVAGDQRWAAAYVWVNEGGDPAPLLALLTLDDPAIRVMAATGLLARGSPEGFEPLIELLVDDSLRPGQPPSEVWRDAVMALVRYTAISELGPPFDATTEQRRAAKERWQAWLDSNRDTLEFDVEEALWIVS